MRIFVAVMNFIYIFYKLGSTRRKVTLISRQSDEPSVDFLMLKERLEQDENLEVVVLTRTLGHGLGGKISYFGHMFTQMHHLATSQVVVLDSYCILASVLHHKKSLCIIQMWHASCAIKKFGHQTIGEQDGTSEATARIMRMHKNYDFVLCASDVTAEYFCQAFDVTKDKIVKNGLPRLDYIRADKEKMREKIFSAYPQLKGKKNILYVPTFRKNRVVDVESLIKNVDLDRYNLIVRLHPLDLQAGNFKKVDGVIYETDFYSFDLLKAADIVISDYSAFVVEASFAGKPVYLYVYDEEEYLKTTGLNVNYANEAIGKYAFRDAGELCRAMEDDYDFAALNTFCSKYIDVNTDDCTGQLVDFIGRHLNAVK